MRRVIALFLIIAGIIVLAFPFVQKYRTKNVQQGMLEDFYSNTDSNIGQNEALVGMQESQALFDDIFRWGDEQGNQDDMTPIEIDEAILGEMEAYNHAVASSNSDSNSEERNNQDNDSSDNRNNTMRKEVEVEKPKAIAIIKIEKIDVHLPIAHGVDLETLKYAIGYMPESGKLGEIGNAVLAGHRSHTYGVFFNRLNELEQGDDIVIMTKDKEYVYTVFKKKIVEPNDTSVLRGSSRLKVITLITCDPVIGATHRLIIHGALSEKNDE